MKAIVNSNLLVDLDMLESGQEVSQIGEYPHYKYKIIGAPKSITIVQDSDLVAGDEAKQVEDHMAAENLKKMEAKYNKLVLDTERKAAVDRIMNEKRGVSREDAMAYAATETYSWNLQKATSEDVRKWLRLKAEKDAKEAAKVTPQQISSHPKAPAQIPHECCPTTR